MSAADDSFRNDFGLVCYDAATGERSNLVAGGLMCEGGVREVVFYWPREMGPAAVGLLGAMSSALLLVSGALLLARRPAADRVARVAAVAMIPVHLAGVLPGYMGVPGAILGIVYPIAMLWALRGTPGLAVPAEPATEARDDDERDGPPLRRSPWADRPPDQGPAGVHAPADR